MNFYIKYKRVIKVLLLLFVLVFVGQFIWNTNFEEIMAYLRKMPLCFLGIVGLSFMAYLSATYAWKLCLGKDGSKTGIGQLFMIRHVGEMLSVFNPASVVAGETLKAHYLKKQGVSNQDSISSILMSRILIILSAILLLLVSSLYLIFKTFGADRNLIAVILVGAAVGGFGYLLARFLLHSKLYLSRFFYKLQKKFGDKYISNKLCASIEDVNRTSYTFYIHNKQKFYIAFFLSIVHWIFGAAEFFLILITLGFDTSFLNAIAIEMGVILFKTLGAVVPGQVGVEEYANKVMLGIIGIVSNEVWLVVSIMRRARQLFWVGVAGIFYWSIARMKMETVVK
ncbi:MAG: lysylphosphatidylglycerol synthase transmembrane domain-containing protein [Bacteroidota bacterium]